MNEVSETAQVKMELFRDRRRAEVAGSDDETTAIDARLDVGLDEVQRVEWREDYLRWAIWDEYPRFAYCGVCDGLLFKDEVGSTRCSCPPDES